MPEVAYCARGGIAWLTVDNPPYNTITTEMFDQLGERMDQASADPVVRTVIIHGAGPQVYTAGAELKEVAAWLSETPAQLHRRALRWLQRVNRSIARIEASPKAVICAMKGISYGGGLEIAAACDVRVAAQNARMAMPELRLGFMPGYGGTQRLTRLIGEGRAKLWMMTGRAVDAAQAERWGLVDLMAPVGEELACAEAIAREIARQAPLAVGGLKTVIRRGLGQPLDQAIEGERRLVAHLCASADFAEGVRSFLAKRDPVWTGQPPRLGR